MLIIKPVKWNESYLGSCGHSMPLQHLSCQSYSHLACQVWHTILGCVVLHVHFLLVHQLYQSCLAFTSDHILSITWFCAGFKDSVSLVHSLEICLNFKKPGFIFKVSSNQKYVFLLNPTVERLSFSVQNDVCAVCFHVHLLKVESFSELIENLILRGGPTSMTCETTNSLEPILVQYSTYTSVMCKLEASSAHTLRMDFTVK